MLLLIIIAVALIDAVLYWILAKIKNRNAVEPDYSDPGQFGVCPSEYERLMEQQRTNKKTERNSTFIRRSGKGTI